MLESNFSALDMRRMPRFAFPIKLEVQRNGWILASFPDVPEALTEGETEREALDEAQDCLIGALGGYIANGWPIPAPSAIEGNAVAELPEGVTLKLALQHCAKRPAPEAMLKSGGPLAEIRLWQRITGTGSSVS